MTAAGMTAGTITVSGDGTYSASPPLGPDLNNPATATSLAQALFEARFPIILSNMTRHVQGQIVDATTEPKTTSKGRVLQNVAAFANADAFAIVGYLQANAVAVVSTQSLGVMPATITAGTPIGAPASPVKVPVE